MYNAAKMLFLHLWILSVLFLAELAKAIGKSNLTNFMRMRQKRSIIYEGGGSIKFSVSGVWPLYLEDRVHWRQVNCIGSIQSSYALPVKPSSPLEKWESRSGKSLQVERDEFDKTGFYKHDPSRMFSYAVLEEYMNRNGRNGRECLLRAICENAQVDRHDDVNSKMLDIILSPGKDNLDEVYSNAMKAGKFGVNCLSAYPKCPYGDSFLDRLAVFN